MISNFIFKMNKRNLGRSPLFYCRTLDLTTMLLKLQFLLNKHNRLIKLLFLYPTVERIKNDDDRVLKLLEKIEVERDYFHTCVYTKY
jgi:hypothetical protein